MINTETGQHMDWNIVEPQTFPKMLALGHLGRSVHQRPRIALGRIQLGFGRMPNHRPVALTPLKTSSRPPACGLAGTPNAPLRTLQCPQTRLSSPSRPRFSILSSVMNKLFWLSTLAFRVWFTQPHFCSRLVHATSPLHATPGASTWYLC